MITETALLKKPHSAWLVVRCSEASTYTEAPPRPATASVPLELVLNQLAITNDACKVLETHLLFPRMDNGMVFRNSLGLYHFSKLIKHILAISFYHRVNSNFFF